MNTNQTSLAIRLKKKQMENANKRMSECTQLGHLRRCPGNSKDDRNFVTAKFVTK